MSDHTDAPTLGPEALTRLQGLHTRWLAYSRQALEGKAHAQAAAYRECAVALWEIIEQPTKNEQRQIRKEAMDDFAEWASERDTSAAPQTVGALVREYLKAGMPGWLR